MLADKKIFRVGTPVDEPMFQRIASHLAQDLLAQFKEESRNASGIRKWAGYEAIAKQVEARGPIEKAAAASAGASEESALDRMIRLRKGGTHG